MSVENDVVLRQQVLLSFSSSVVHQIDETLSYCVNLKAGSYPTTAPIKALEAIEKGICSHRKRIQKALGDSKKFTYPRYVSDICITKAMNTSYLALVAHYLREIRNARYAIAPAYALPCFHQMAMRIVDAYEAECRKYTLHHPSVEHLTRSASSSVKKNGEDVCKVTALPIFSGIEPRGTQNVVPFEFDKGDVFYVDGTFYWFMFFHFPILDRHSVGVLPLFFHEFAHFIWLLDSNKVEDSAQPAESMDLGSSHSQKGDELNEDEVLESWKEEIVADILATRIVGPAYVASLTEFSTRGLGSSPTPTHPSPLLRFDVIMRELERMAYKDLDCRKLAGYRNAFKAIGKAKSEGAASASLTQVTQLKKLEEFDKRMREDLMGSSLGHVEKEANRLMDGIAEKGLFGSFSTSTFERAERMVREKILQLMPPSRTQIDSDDEEPTDPIAVLNSASLVYRMEGEGQSVYQCLRAKMRASEEDKDAAVEATISKLIRKALEVAAVEHELA